MSIPLNFSAVLKVTMKSRHYSKEQAENMFRG